MPAIRSAHKVTLGIGGARRNAAVALCRNGEVIAACEQERITRARDAGMPPEGFPREAMEAVLQIAGCTRADVTACGFAEDGIEVPPDLPGLRLPHHLAHATAAFLTSPFREAVVVICGQSVCPEVAVFMADGSGIRDLGWPWQGRGFTGLYSLLTEAVGLAPQKDEHRMEALARQGDGGKGQDRQAVSALFALERDRLSIDPNLAERVATLMSVRTSTSMSFATRQPGVAGALQAHLGDLLIEFLRGVRAQVPTANLCLAGGLFYNTNINTRIRQSRVFDEVFIPVHPGNAGLAVGCALAAIPDGERPSTGTLVSPFLGPEYPETETKAILDNCKLSYGYADDGELIRDAVEALRRGHLLGWFQGRMEWGPRALGARSILASPSAPYVLENLNAFLKRRDPPRSYAVSICEEDLDRWFDGPSPSALMQFEHRVKDAAAFSQIMSGPDAPIRVHTVGRHPPALRRLLTAFGQATGLPVLVNTSFNGFHEPIVCTPRDAVRVFYGTGLDMLVAGNFVIRK
ncbi:MAG: hypothetical protein H0U19_12715 [Acidobacteria bacterium]|nr:hypothetical protein [Acidobacteriota bacterium]